MPALPQMILHDLTSQDRGQAEALFRGDAALAFATQPTTTPSIRLAAGDVPGVAPGQELSDEQRIAALEAMNAGAVIWLDVDLLSYRQSKERGQQRNRNNVRVRAGQFRAMARTGRNTPFLVDHAWGDVAKRGGTITDSRPEVSEDGTEQRLMQRATLTAAPVVRAALEGNLDRLSVGMVATTQFECTYHNAPVRECWCWPGQRHQDEATGAEVVVEWEADFELVETSGVNVPAVTGTSVGAPVTHGAHKRQREERMNEDEKLKQELARVTAEKLAADERASAAEQLAATRTSERDQSRAELAAERERAREKDADAFVAGLVADGRVAEGGAMASHLRGLVLAGKNDAAQALADELQDGAHAPFSKPQRTRAKDVKPEVTAKVWSLPMKGDKLDREALLSTLSAWPASVRERAAAMVKNSTFIADPVTALLGLEGTALNKLLAQDGYEPLNIKISEVL